MIRGTAISIRLDEFADRAWRLAARTSGVSLRDWCDGAAHFALSEEGAQVVQATSAPAPVGEMSLGVTVEVTARLLEQISARLQGSTVRQWLRYHLTAVALYELADRGVSVEVLPPEVDDPAPPLRPTRKRREPKEVIVAPRKQRRKRVIDQITEITANSPEPTEEQLQAVATALQTERQSWVVEAQATEIPTELREVYGMSNKALMAALLRGVSSASQIDLRADPRLAMIIAEAHKRMLQDPGGFSLRDTSLVQNAVRGVESARSAVPAPETVSLAV